MGQLSKATQQNASASEELAATSEELSGQAQQLQESVSFFSADTDHEQSKKGRNDTRSRTERRGPHSPMRGRDRESEPMGSVQRAATGTSGNFRAY